MSYTDNLKRTLPDNPLPYGHIRALGISRLESDFVSLPLRNEQWKYTRLKFDLDAKPLFQIETSGVVSSNGVSLKRAADLTEAELNEIFAELTKPKRESFITTLGSASVSEILVLEIEPNTDVDNLIKVHLTSKSSAIESALIFVRMGSGSRARIHFDLESAGSGGYQVLNLFGECAENTHLEISSLRRRVQAGTLVDRHFVLGKNAKLRINDIDLGGGSGNPSRGNTFVDLKEPYSEVDMSGLVVVGDTDHVDEHYFVNHLARETESRLLFKSALGGRSTVVYDGLVFIEKDAQKVDSNQLSKALLLSQGATVDAKPELEVFADDVKAAHGSTVGQLSPEEVFYLMSRGISKSRAINMVALGFVKEVALKVGDVETREALLAAVSMKLSEIMAGVDLDV